MSDSLETQRETLTNHTHFIRKLGPGLIYNIIIHIILHNKPVWLSLNAILNIDVFVFSRGRGIKEQ